MNTDFIPTNCRLLAGLTFLISVLGLSTAKADNLPVISGTGVVEVQNEFATDSDNSAADEQNNLFLRSELAPRVTLNKHFSMSGVFVLEPVQAFDAGEDNAFEEQGVFVEEINLSYSQGPVTLKAGKFNPGFGIAWEPGRGIWGEDFAEDYEIAEKIGGAVSYELAQSVPGTHTLTASTFFSDTSFLSHSAPTGRGPVDEEDGGAANTQDFSSYVLGLQGQNTGGVEGLYYKLAYRDLARGDAAVQAGGDDEQGLIATLGHRIELAESGHVDGLLEYTEIDNFDAGPNDRDYLTASLDATIRDHWLITASYTARDTDVAGTGERDDHLLQLSGGYDFGNGLTLEVGWRNSETAGVDTDIIGGLARYNISF